MARIDLMEQQLRVYRQNESKMSSQAEDFKRLVDGGLLRMDA